jgi:predicted nucleotidyltransferase
VLKWPDRATVDLAVRQWAAEMRRQRPEIVRIGYFGSYARGDWGVGSDLDVIIVVSGDDRVSGWSTAGLPVHADVLVYTSREWESLLAGGGRFARTVKQEAVWV